MTNQPKDLDMSNVTDDAIEMLYAEMDDLDIPMVMVPDALEIMGDAFDIDPKTLITAMMGEGEGLALDTLRDSHGSKEINLMIEMVSHGIESSTQLPHILRALEIAEGINALS